MSLSYYTVSFSLPYIRLHEGPLPASEAGWRTNNADSDLKNVYTIGKKEYEVSRIDLADVGTWGVIWRVTLLVVGTICTLGGAWFFKPFRTLCDEVNTRQIRVSHATYLNPTTFKAIDPAHSEKLKQKEPLAKSLLPKQPPESKGSYSQELFNLVPLPSDPSPKHDVASFKKLLDDENVDINAPGGKANEPIIFHTLRVNARSDYNWLLIQHPKFDDHVKNQQGQTPLEFLFNVLLLLDDTIRFERFEGWCPHIVKALIEKTDLNQPFSNGVSPFEYLLEMKENYKMGREDKIFLIKWFVEVRPELALSTLARLTSGLASQRAYEFLHLALEKSGNLNYDIDESENSPLHLFLQNSYLLESLPSNQLREILRLFKSKHANFHARNREGDTPFRCLLKTIENSSELTTKHDALLAAFLSGLPPAYQNAYLQDIPEEEKRRRIKNAEKNYKFFTQLK